MFEGHFSERALNRLLKEEPVGVPSSPSSKEAPAGEGSDASRDASGPAQLIAAAQAPEAAKDDASKAVQSNELSSPLPTGSAKATLNPATAPEEEIQIWKNPEDRPAVPAPQGSESVPLEAPHEMPRNLAPARTMVPFVEYAPPEPLKLSRANVVVPDLIPAPMTVLVEEEPLVPVEEVAGPVADTPVQPAAPAQLPAVASRPGAAHHMDFACQTGMNPQRFVLFKTGLERLSERLTAANEMPARDSEEALPAPPDLEEAFESRNPHAGFNGVPPVTEPQWAPDSVLGGPEAAAEAVEEPAEAAQDTWTDPEWQESKLLPIPRPKPARNRQFATPRCTGFASRDPEFSISQPVFDPPQSHDIGKVPELVTDPATWQGHADPGQSIEIHWLETPLGKLSTECVAGPAVRLAFPAVGIKGRGHGPRPVRPIGPIGLPQQLTPPPNVPADAGDEFPIQAARKDLSRRPAPRQEAESDVDQVEARLQSLTALARSAQHRTEETPRPAATTTEASDKDEAQASGFVPPPALTAPLPVTLLGSAAPRRRATVVFPIGIQAPLGPVISIPARVPIREVIYLLGGEPEEGVEDGMNEFEWTHPEADPAMPHETEDIAEAEPYGPDVPSALANDRPPYDDLAGQDEPEGPNEVFPQEGPEHV